MKKKQFTLMDIFGKGVCLVDFGCSIDTRVFSEDTMFVGSNDANSFLQCPAMLEGRPWKWQVRVADAMLRDQEVSTLFRPTTFTYSTTSRVGKGRQTKKGAVFSPVPRSFQLFLFHQKCWQH